MGNCKDCQFYNKEKSTCEKIDYEKGGKIDQYDFRLRVSVADDTDLCVDLVVGPLFGCLKFEPKGLEDWGWTE